MVFLKPSVLVRILNFNSECMEFIILLLDLLAYRKAGK